MSMKIIAVNAGPRKGWNTDTLIEKAMEGAREAGAEVEKFDLFRLEKYTGCISCFGCDSRGGWSDHRFAELPQRTDRILPRTV